LQVPSGNPTASEVLKRLCRTLNPGQEGTAVIARPNLGFVGVHIDRGSADMNRRLVGSMLLVLRTHLLLVLRTHLLGLGFCVRICWPLSLVCRKQLAPRWQICSIKCTSLTRYAQEGCLLQLSNLDLIYNTPRVGGGGHLEIVWERDGFLPFCVWPHMVVIQHPFGRLGAWDEEGGPRTPVGAPVLHVVGHRVSRVLQVHPADVQRPW